VRKMRAVLVVACACAALTTGYSPTAGHADSTPAPSGQVDDPELLEDIHDATIRSERTGQPAEVTVEVLTDHTEQVAAQVRAAGGSVTGSVAGAVVQARLPVESVATVAALATVGTVRHPHRAGYVPSDLRRTDGLSPGFGPTVGSQVNATNAAAWHVAGQVGAGVKVGIIDFFDFTVWAPSEQGTVPDASHQFCRDTTGTLPSLCNPDGTISTAAVLGTDSGKHGVAVAEIIRDMAPGVEVFVASAGTVSDLSAAVDWMANNGVTIVSRSLGAAYDGPGDGTGPLATVVDNAVARGLTWFNSAGNDAIDAYVRRSVPTSLPANGYVNWNDGRFGIAGVDEWLRIDSEGCYFLDGIRWSNDWYLPAAQRTDYSVEVWQPTSPLGVGGDHFNPLSLYASPMVVIDANQRAGAAPLEGADQMLCPNNGYGPSITIGGPPSDVSYIRVKLNAATPVGSAADQLELAISGPALTELFYSDVAFTAAKPVVDSRNPGLVAVGAVDPPPTAPGVGPFTIASYSSQGPTNDGRLKPDVSAPSGFASTIFGRFSGTSAAAPTAAGVGALLQGAGLAAPGAATAALVKHFVRDLGAPGADNAYGTGIVELPAPPAAAPAVTPSRFVPLATAQRVLDTRQGALHVGPSGTVGPYAPQSIFEFNVPSASPVPADAAAVAVNITSVAPPTLGFVQAYPYMRARTGGTSTLNLSTVGLTRPNFAIVPIGQDGNISVYVQAGGDIIIDLLGYYATGNASPADGRFVPLDSPQRVMDTRSPAQLPSSFGGVSRRLAAGETVTVPSIGPGLPLFNQLSAPIEAVVMTVAAVNADGPGFLRVFSGSAPQGSNVNYVPGAASANTVIVPGSGANGPVVYTSQAAHVIVDIIGYITGDGGPTSTAGTFVPISPTRAYDTRALGQPFAAGETRGFYITGGSTGVPDGIGGVSANLTVVAPGGNGFLKAYPGNVPPLTSTSNYAAGKTVATGTLMGVNQIGVSNSITAAMSQSGHLIIDINGYFVAASS
jgi:hypothetical protein